MIPGLRRAIVLLLVPGCLALGPASVTAARAGGHPVPVAPDRAKVAVTRGGPDHLHRFREAEAKARLGKAFAATAGPSSAAMDLYDARFYDLALALDPVAKLLTGTLTLTATVTGAGLAALDLDLDPNMIVTATKSGGVATTFTRSGAVLTVVLDRAYLPGESVTVAVDYFGNPTSDYFGFATYGGQPLIWSLSEPYGARRWWPCKDLNTDKADSVALHVTVPDNLIVASNGTLEAESVPGPGLKTFHWTERHPIATYLVSVTAHPYVVLTDAYVSAGGDTMPIVHYVVSDRVAQATAGYAPTAAMIGAFAGLYGEYPYLDEKYGHAHFLWGGGMEHQTCSSMNSSAYLETFIAHELAHQWMGDLVTCADFSHIWINEGFATWSEAYWREQNEGPAAYREEMDAARFYGPGTIYVENPNNFNEIFNFYLSYQKASWVPHMLRHVVGETAFRAGLAELRAAHGFGAATTGDLQAVFEAVSGRDLEAFFQQWIYGEYYPRYEVAWNASAAGAGQTHVQLRITQLPVAGDLFAMPLDVRIATSLGDTTFVVENAAATEWYAFTVAGTVTDLQLDPDGWVLCEIFPDGASGVPTAAAGRPVLAPNVPNPFNPATTVRFELAVAGAVTLDVHDVSGRRVRRLIAADLGAGPHAVVWRGRDDAGRDVASGTYFVRLRQGEATDVRALTLVR
ncbi:hypothetical protein KDM41_16045 [bacterium]|nr:hypothetical protein [bacterium]